MAGTLKAVRFVRAWQSYRVGAVITPNGTLRDFLVQNGFAVIVADAPRPLQAPVNRLARPAQTRKRA